MAAVALIVIDVDTLSSGMREEVLHVLQGRDRDADLAGLALCDRGVGIVAHLRRQVEGHREARLSLVEQEAIALVRLRRRAEAGVLPHRPQARPVAGRMHPARERKLARRPGRRRRRVGGPVHPLDRLPGRRRGLSLAHL
jgi:hypothetical protein